MHAVTLNNSLRIWLRSHLIVPQFDTAGQSQAVKQILSVFTKRISLTKNPLTESDVFISKNKPATKEIRVS